MSSITSSAQSRRAKRRHSIQRLGLAATRSSGSRSQTIIGITLIWVGWYLRRSAGSTHLYTHKMKHGEAVRINVLRGGTSLADTTIGS